MDANACGPCIQGIEITNCTIANKHYWHLFTSSTFKHAMVSKKQDLNKTFQYTIYWIIHKTHLLF